LSGIVKNLVEKNRIAEGRLRITLTRGTSELSATPRYDSPTVLVTIEPYREPPRTKYLRGCKIIISKFRVLSEDILSRVKSIDRLRHILAKEDAQRSGADEALFLNEKNQIAECTVSNIFLVSAGGLLTPPRSAGILEGTMRNLVMSLAARSGIEVRESALPVESLFNTDEVFLTNSLSGVLPVCRVGARKVGKKPPGAVTRSVWQLYQDAVKRELRT
jgi:branched-chain amino acid aminotransferase